MVKNIYGQAIRDMEKMRVEEKIDHIKNAIPDDLYKVLTEEWHRFVKSSVKKGQADRELVEFDYFFELFMKFPHWQVTRRYALFHCLFSYRLSKNEKPLDQMIEGLFLILTLKTRFSLFRRR